MKLLSLGVGACLVLSGLLVADLLAQQEAPGVPLASRDAGPAGAIVRRTTAFRLPWTNSLDTNGGHAVEPAAASNAKHPLIPAVQFAAGVADQIHEHVHDYTCILIKRERIEDELQDFQTMRARARCAASRMASRRSPLACFWSSWDRPRFEAAKCCS